MTETVQAPAEALRYVGGGVLRKEDPELITGQAQFVDDIALPGMVWIGIVRSAYAHARINSVDVSRARETLREQVASLAVAGAEKILRREVNADPQAAWKMLIAPAKWWSSDHTWSKDAANLYLDAQATGCFCDAGV